MSRDYLLNRPMVLQDRVQTPDGMGGQRLDWQPLGTHWCELRSRVASLRLLGGYAQSKGTARIYLRAVAIDAPSRPKAGQRFANAGRLFTIVAVSEADAEARYIECQVEEVQG
ncbi:MAG: head-tail adaptor protein [Paracoccaceae bacterium]